MPVAQDSLAVMPVCESNAAPGSGSGGRMVPAHLDRPGSGACTQASRVAALVSEMSARHAADLLLIAGWPPVFGIHGQWTTAGERAMAAGDIDAWLRATLDAEQWGRLAAERDLDFSLRLAGGGRVRVNAHYQRGAPAAAIRAIPGRVPSLDELHLPPVVADMAAFPHGLVLVTGGAGHGKSTTLAAMIQRLNETRACHVVTLEDPVEYEFPPGRAIIEQREIGSDCPSFASGLRHVLRQRPDVILVGEMRDLDTISVALSAAETGHLVLATLHTSNAPSALGRIVDVFPANAQPQVRTQLAASLRAVLAQALLTTADHSGLLPMMELLLATDAVRRAIRDNETHLLYGIMETGRNAGMNTMEQALAAAVQGGSITAEAALAAAPYAERLAKLI